MAAVLCAGLNAISVDKACLTDWASPWTWMAFRHLSSTDLPVSHLDA